MTQPVPEDVTEHLRGRGHLTAADYNSEDRVYRCGPVLVKVKTFHEPPAEHGEEILRLSGSVVGEDGKALTRDDGKLAIYKYGRHLTVHAYAPTDIARDLERERLNCVTDTVTAHDHYNQVRGLSGVATVERPQAEAPQIPPEAHAHRRGAARRALKLPAPLSPDEDPELEPIPAAIAEPADARHPSGRRHLLHPGLVVDGAGVARHVSAKALAAARGLKLSACIVYNPEREPGYYAGLTSVYPGAADLPA